MIDHECECLGVCCVCVCVTAGSHVRLTNNNLTCLNNVQSKLTEQFRLAHATCEATATTEIQTKRRIASQETRQNNTK